MKILSIGNFGHGWDGSICDEEHIAGALEELGHEVTRIQREDVGKPGVDPHSINRPYDFTLVAQWHGFTEEQLIFIKLEPPVVYWVFDHQDRGQLWHLNLIEAADLYLSKRISDSEFTNWQWLSQDFSPKFLDKHPETIEKDIDVLFTGSYLDFATERNETLKAVDEKFNLVIHSVNEWPGFKNVHPPIMDEGLPELYARAKIILSIDHTLEAGYWSDRNAQIMACRGLVLFRYVPLSEARFIGGTHVMFYNKEHCLEEIEELLTMHEEDLEAIREVGYRLAHQNLMVEHRVNDLITIVESIL